MRVRSLVPALVTIALAAVPVAAQRLGTVELSGFLQGTRPDPVWKLDTSFGLACGIGVFLTPRLEVEFQRASTRFDPVRPRGFASVPGHSTSGRLTYNHPFSSGRRVHHLMIGAGATDADVEGTSSTGAVLVSVGGRLSVARWFAVRPEIAVERFAEVNDGLRPPRHGTATNKVFRIGASLLLHR